MSGIQYLPRERDKKHCAVYGERLREKVIPMNDHLRAWAESMAGDGQSEPRPIWTDLARSRTISRHEAAALALRLLELAGPGIATRTASGEREVWVVVLPG